MKIEINTNTKSVNLADSVIKKFIKIKYKKSAKDFLYDFDWNLIGFFDLRGKYYDLEDENLNESYILDFLEKLDEKGAK